MTEVLNIKLTDWRKKTKSDDSGVETQRMRQSMLRLGVQDEI